MNPQKSTNKNIRIFDSEFFARIALAFGTIAAFLILLAIHQTPA